MKHVAAMITLFALALCHSTAFGRVELREADIRNWADDVFPRALEERRFSGLGLTAVQDGRVVATLTYGFEKWGEKKPIDPARTQFRIGSDSKTFTATAVAQLWDRGDIDSLDDPANRYLTRVQLPDWEGQDITIWDLLTHRAGFEVIGKGIASDEDVEVPVSGEIVEWLMPELVRPPGTLTVYCNYCTSLLGALVEDVTGQTLHDYLVDNVFRPLGMRNTILGYDHRPTPDVGIPEIFFPNGDNEPLKHVGIHPFIAPAGNIYSPLNDMAAYMLAHLDAGRSGGNALMSARAFDTMHTLKVRNHPEVSGIGMKFMVHDWNGERVVEHGGGWPGYYTSMTLFPESNAGIFVSAFAGSPPADLWAMLANKLGMSNRMTPAEGVPQEPPLSTFRLHDMALTRFLGPFTRTPVAASERQGVDEFVGLYRGERRNHTSGARLGDLLGGSSFKVAAHPDGGLEIDGRGPYLQVAPDTFWLEGAVEGDFADHSLSYLYAFMRDEAGNISHLTGEISINPAVPVPAWKSPEFGLSAMLIALGLAVTGLLTFLWQRFGLGSPGLNAGLIGLAVCALAIAVGMMNVLGPGRGYSPMPDIALGRTGGVLAVLLFTNLFALLALLVAWLSARNWTAGGWGSGVASWIYRLQVSAIALSGLAAIAILWVHGGIGFNLP